MKKIDLTIIIPVYNASNYLNKGFNHLKPIYNTNISFEIIYVNDGSTDNSLEILKEIEKNNKFIKIITQENQGLSGARNTAIEVAKGEYIQFLDADDIIDIDKIVLLLQKAKQKKVDLIGFRLDYIDENYNTIGIREKQPLPFNKIISGNDALVSGFIPSSMCVFLFDRNFLNNNKLRIYPKIAHQDVEFTSRVMLVAERIMFTDVIAYHYLQRQNSITKPQSKVKIKQLLDDEITVAKLIKAGIKKDYNKSLMQAIEKNYNSVVWNLLWRFISKPKETDMTFIVDSINRLRQEELYPIKGSLKTVFQKITRPFINNKYLLFSIIKIKSIK